MIKSRWICHGQLALGKSCDDGVDHVEVDAHAGEEGEGAGRLRHLGTKNKMSQTFLPSVGKAIEIVALHSEHFGCDFGDSA